MSKRILIVFDGDCWFIRRVRASEHDAARDEKVYRCDEHLGGPFGTLDEAVAALEPADRERGEGKKSTAK